MMPQMHLVFRPATPEMVRCVVALEWQHMANYLSILHAKSAAKQTQSQLFHPCFFTKILWSGFAYCNLDFNLDPKNPQSIFPQSSMIKG